MAINLDNNAENAGWIGSTRRLRPGFQERLGNCYELAAQYVLAGPGRLLVHGTIQGYGHPPNPHAWVQDAETGEVYDPVAGLEFSDLAWVEFANPTVGHVYDREATRQRIVDSEHWGPWE